MRRRWTASDYLAGILIGSCCLVLAFVAFAALVTIHSLLVGP
jgi:hypothetical protein